MGVVILTGKIGIPEECRRRVNPQLYAADVVVVALGKEFGAALPVVLPRKNTLKKNGKSVKHLDENEVTLEAFKTSYHGLHGTIIGLIGISRDITERKNRKKECGTSVIITG